jgi:hypothetical protein
MTTRSHSKSVVFSHSFELKGVDRILPPGEYRIVTDEELINCHFLNGRQKEQSMTAKTFALIALGALAATHASASLLRLG